MQISDELRAENDRLLKALTEMTSAIRILAGDLGLHGPDQPGAGFVYQPYQTTPTQCLDNIVAAVQRERAAATIRQEALEQVILRGMREAHKEAP